MRKQTNNMCIKPYSLTQYYLYHKMFNIITNLEL